MMNSHFQSSDDVYAGGFLGSARVDELMGTDPNDPADKITVNAGIDQTTN
jgi:hypothetical protein